MFKIVFYRTLFSQSAASLTAGYLTAYLRQNDLSVRMELLEKGRMDNSLKVMAEHEKYPVIIYKCNFQDYDEGLELLSHVKNVSNKCKIFVMGYFAEINARQIMERYRFIDGVVYGDGCIFSLQYAKSCGTELIGGLFRTEDESLIEDKQHVFIPLNKLPNPARDIEQQEKGKYINIIWREGCFGTCKFCHINLVKRPFSERRVEDVVNEIEDCYVKMGKRMFFFNDSVFWWGEQDDDKLERFIELMKQKKLDIAFMIYLRCQPSR